MPHFDSEKKETNRAKIKFTQAKKDRDVEELKVNFKLKINHSNLQ